MRALLNRFKAYRGGLPVFLGHRNEDLLIHLFQWILIPLYLLFVTVSVRVKNIEEREGRANVPAGTTNDVASLLL